jgi:hypothetical protein
MLNLNRITKERMDKYLDALAHEAINKHKQGMSQEEIIIELDKLTEIYPFEAGFYLGATVGFKYIDILYKDEMHPTP